MLNVSNVSAAGWRACLVLTALVFLSACAGTISSTVYCPPIVQYDPAFQNRAADELDGLPEGSALVTLVEDYSHLRDQIRACEGAK